MFTSRAFSFAAAWLALLLPRAAAAQTFPDDPDWVPLLCDGQPAWDPLADEAGANGSRDIVGDSTDPAGYIAADTEFVFFRMRIDANAASRGEFDSFGWAVEMDLDRVLDTYEFLLMVNGIANPDEVTFEQNTVQGTMGSPSDGAELVLAAYNALTHARCVPAASTFGGDADYFVDLAVARADLQAAGIVASTPLALFFGTSSSAHSITADLMCNNGASDPFTLVDSGTDLTTWTGTPPTGDSDGDTVPDATDNCPDVPNPDQTDTDGAGDACDDDSDNDGLSDTLEAAHGTRPDDSDSDDDGLSDGMEIDLGTDPLDPDTDDDGLPDGTEVGIVDPGPGTDTSRGRFQPDQDPATTTDPRNPDTDGDGTPDGWEDCNGNGRVDPGERDPNDPGDAGEPRCVPTTELSCTDGVDDDGDGLTDCDDPDCADDPACLDRHPIEIGGGGGCGCRTAPGATGSTAFLLPALALALAARPRRRP